MPRPAPSPRCAPPRFDLVRYAKASGAALLLVGHVTKDGQIAGPKAVEHLVDAVLYFEGERGHHFRVLRAVKNRFGPTDEIGVFEMTGQGAGRSRQSVGAVPGRPQQRRRRARRCSPAWKARGRCCAKSRRWWRATGYGTPRRAVVGWDTGRLAMILAVLDARAGVGIGGADVYLNVAGGLKIGEPAADLAAAAALVSSFGGEPLPRDCVFFGEISLSGDIRPVPQAELRLKEAAKLGFKAAFMPDRHQSRRCGPEINRSYQRGGPCWSSPETEARKARRRGRIESMNLYFTFVDFLVVAVILVSAVLCRLARLSVTKPSPIFAWAAAAFATLYFGPWLVPLAAQHDRHALAGARCWPMPACSWWCSFRFPS